MLSRSRLLTLFALLVVGLLAGCGNSNDDKGGGGGGGQSEDPAALLKKAFAAQPTSGELKLKVGVDVQGSTKMSGPASFTLEGPFKSRGKDELPLLDWDVTVSGAGQNFSGGVVATEDNAYVKFRGQTYEVGTELYKQFVRQQKLQQSKSDPQDLKNLGIDPSAWLQDGKVTDGESIGGAATRKVTGTIDVQKMVDDISEAAKSPELRKQIPNGQSVPEISDADKQKVVDAVKEAKLTVNVDDKDIARKVLLSATFDVPKGVDADGATGGSFDFQYELPKVGEGVDITAPTDAKPLALLLQQLGLNGALPGGGLKTQ